MRSYFRSCKKTSKETKQKVGEVFDGCYCGDAPRIWVQNNPFIKQNINFKYLLKLCSKCHVKGCLVFFSFKFNIKVVNLH